VHYLGFVFVKELTDAAVAEAMEDYQDREWDWYRCGGRWDGYLLGDEEMKSRETHNGFNFESSNERPERNCCKASELPADKRPHFFVANGRWVPVEYWDAHRKSEHFKGYGAFVLNEHFDERLKQAMTDNADGYVVVVDVHN
jgi:hypothetical protein